MNMSKICAAVVLASTLVTAVTPAASASFGRSSGGARSSAVFRSAPRPSTPATPAPPPAAAPAKPGGIGGTTGSIGVRKSDVTSPAAGAPPARQSNNNFANGQGQQNFPNSYQAPPVSLGGPTNTSTFLSSLGGSFVGASLSNMLFNSSHRSPSATSNILPVQQTTTVTNSDGTQSQTVVSQVPVKKPYGIGDFIIDIILFAILLCTLVGLAFLIYKGYKMIREYYNRERGIAPTIPFSPTARFWEIQQAFADADAVKLKTMLGPDMTEALFNLVPTQINITDVSHEVALQNQTEFSVEYHFTDSGTTVRQMWHYEKHSGNWVLNGLENM